MCWAWPAAAQLVETAPAAAPDALVPNPTQYFAVHGQATGVEQYHPAFTAPYSGKQSLNPGNRGDETTAATLYLGVRPWAGAEIWADPEIDQGFGLSNTFGVAGFPNGEAYKIGQATPYLRVQRLFLRQTFNLGGSVQNVDPDANVLGGTQSANRVVITLGKFSATDIFDTNQYAHDPANDFLNWSVLDAGSWDYAADAWGYTYGGVVEWYQNWWTLRAGLLDLSTYANSTELDPVFISQSQFNLELEERHHLFGHPGKLKVLYFLSRGRLGTYSDALAQARATGGVPNVNDVLRYRSKAGISLNLEQELTPDLGMFARAGWSQGDVQAYDFTDISQTVSVGLSLKGDKWGRADDTVGIAGVLNNISGAAQSYFNAGGLGVLIGDGQLPKAGLEQILEAYYSYAATSHTRLTADYQFIGNPAYNLQRGPVSVFALRLHGEF